MSIITNQKRRELEAVARLLESDAMTPNHDGTPEFYYVDAANVEYLVRTVLGTTTVSFYTAGTVTLTHAAIWSADGPVVEDEDMVTCPECGWMFEPEDQEPVDDLDRRVTCEGCGESHDHCTCVPDRG